MYFEYKLLIKRLGLSCSMWFQLDLIIPNINIYPCHIDFSGAVQSWTEGFDQIFLSLIGTDATVDLAKAPIDTASCISPTA